MTEELFQFGDFLLDPAQGLLLRGSERISLAPQPFRALTVLVGQRGNVVTKSELLAAVWPDSFVEESSLTQCIFLLRKALGKSAGREIIETLPKRGYRIALQVDIVTRGLLARVPSAPTPFFPGVQVLETGAAELPTAPSKPDQAQAQTLPGYRQDAVAKQSSNTLRLWLRGAAIALLAAIALFFSLTRPVEHPAVLSAVRLTSDGAYKERLLTLLADRTRIYFSENVDAAVYLAEIPVGGGEIARRPAPHAMDSALALSPATSEILFGPLWEQAPEHRFTAMAAGPGTLRSLGDLSGHAAAWSHDGTRIAFARGLGLFVANADGSGSHEIAHLPETPYWPRWSPDQKRIRFSIEHWNHNVGLWEVDADGSNLHPLFADEPWAKKVCCGDWSPDQRYYVFVRDEAHSSSLWVARDRRLPWQSVSPTRLAEGPVDFWRAPLVAADGRHIYTLGESARGELVRYDASSRKFEPYLDGLSTDTIAFSRDRRWVAWTAYPEGTLWRSRVDGTERMRLTEEGSVARFPQWSPDGTQLTFITTIPAGQWKIFRISANGGSPEPLIADNSNQGVPSWSPDGRQIVFGQIVRFGVDRQDQQQLRIYDLSTHQLATIPGSTGLWTARWSPTGEYISAVSVDNRRLMLFNRRTSQWSRLADIGTNDCVWSHDGQYLFFDSPWEPMIYRVQVSTGRLERYADLKGLRRTGFFGWSLNLAPDDTPLLLKEAGMNEVYSLQVRLP